MDNDFHLFKSILKWDSFSNEVIFFREFGDLHPKAINEQWYKSAVLQHQYDESFVYSVPAYGTYNLSKDNDLVVTASFAIFPSDGGEEAPGSVVGYQFSQKNLQARVKEISNKSSVSSLIKHYSINNKLKEIIRFNS